MGTVLQIRVIAQTLSASDMGWFWRRLCFLAFGEVPNDKDKRGVLELVDALVDKFRFGDMDKELKAKLEPGLEKAAAIKGELEDALDRLEDVAPEPGAN